MELNDRERTLKAVCHHLVGSLDAVVREMRDLQVSMARRQRKIEDNIAIARDLMAGDKEER